ncbi:thioredoxin family protein [Haladaptatus sp. GCM10025707]|uniref:thioredoxin family protein n=1 Tax=unclassified Haladaptatus TaxID=2622732 RepID=UPI0023E858E0|nr:thioredoxin family protein [Haladaptatus sp. QDMS2]
MTATTPAKPDRPVRLESAAELDALVADHDLVLVDFYTKGCTLCQSIEPVLGNVHRVSEAVVALINPVNDIDLVETYNVRSVPTLLLFKDGDVVGRLAEGFQSTEQILSFVESA